MFYVTGAFFGVGNLILAGFVHLIFGGIKTGDWRFFLRVISLLALASAMIIYFLLEDSFRALIIKRHVNEGVAVLNHIGRLNHGQFFQEITFDERMEINEWLNNIYAMNNVDAGARILVQSPLLRITALHLHSLFPKRSTYLWVFALFTSDTTEIRAIQPRERRTGAARNKPRGVSGSSNSDIDDR